MNYKGAYESGAYDRGDVTVYTDNVAYIAIRPVPSGATPHEELYWARLDQPLQEVVLMFHGMLAELQGKAAGIEDVQKQIAPEYTKTTYSKGAIRSHSGKLYEAKQDIGTAEDWTAAHWQEITIGATLTVLNAAAATIPDNINDEAITLKDSSDNEYLITVDASGDTPELDVTLIEAEGGES